MSAAEDAGVERGKHLANKIVRLLNRAHHPADAMTALQLVVASVLEHTGIPPETFMHRVIVSIERSAAATCQPRRTTVAKRDPEREIGA